MWGRWRNLCWSRFGAFSRTSSSILAFGRFWSELSCMGDGPQEPRMASESSRNVFEMSHFFPITLHMLVQAQRKPASRLRKPQMTQNGKRKLHTGNTSSDQAAKHTGVRPQSFKTHTFISYSVYPVDQSKKSKLRCFTLTIAGKDGGEWGVVGFDSQGPCRGIGK